MNHPWLKNFLVRSNHLKINVEVFQLEADLKQLRSEIEDWNIAVTRDMKEKITLNALTGEGVE